MDRPVLVGRSMAGILVADLAGTHPGRLGGGGVIVLGPVLLQGGIWGKNHRGGEGGLWK